MTLKLGDPGVTKSGVTKPLLTKSLWAPATARDNASVLSHLKCCKFLDGLTIMRVARRISYSSPDKPDATSVVRLTRLA